MDFATTASPFAVLQHMAEQARLAAAPIPSGGADDADEWYGLGFQLSGRRLVAPMTEISEVLTAPRLTRIPGVRPWVLGVANLRGRLIPVHDLHVFLGLTPTLPRSQWRVLLVEAPGNQDLVAGLVVEASHGMQHFMPDAREERQPDDLQELLPWCSGCWNGGEEDWFEISLHDLIRSHEFQQVAGATG